MPLTVADFQFVCVDNHYGRVVVVEGIVIGSVSWDRVCLLVVLCAFIHHVFASLVCDVMFLFK